MGEARACGVSWLLAGLLVCLAACGGDSGSEPASGDAASDVHVSGDATASTSDGASSLDGHAGASDAPVESDGQGVVTDDVSSAPGPDIHEGPVLQVDHWCEAVRGGPAGTRPLAQDLARAHVAQRLFGPSADWLGADAILVSLLAADGALGAPLVAAYADSFEAICAVDAGPTPTSQATVTLHGTVAVITPGEGALTLPSEAAGVVVDLRAPASDEAVTAALAAAIQGNLTVAMRNVREFHGFPAQDDDWTHYEVSNVSLPVTIQGTAAADLPLVVLSPQRLSGEVATLVGGLRVTGRAGLAGHDVFAAVAESAWSGLEAQGLAWRASTLRTSGTRWPDVIASDLETSDLEAIVAEIASLSAPGVVGSITTRPDLSAYDRGAGLPDATLDRGAMRAALLVAYGTLDLFYAYFDLVGRDLDQALLDALAEVDETEHGDRWAMKHIMGRFMHDLYDGHGFYWDEAGEDWPDGWMALQIQEIDGLPVVRTSLTPDIVAGDTILSVDGTPITDWYAEAMSRFSASSDGYRFVLATDELTEVWGAPEWVLRDIAGKERKVTAQAVEWELIEAVPWGGTDRESGWLGDLGQPDVYFVNMASSVTPDVSGVVAELASAGQPAGVVLDMRDYPYLDIYEFARTFNSEHFSAPLFGFPTWRGPWEYAVEFEAWEFDPASHVIEGPVVLMVSHKSVSAAECFAQMVMGLDNVTVVGQQSASTNGTITTAWLPGQWEITFTGMRLTNPDGSEFHGIGVVPDVEVVPTATQFAEGVDPELEVALEVLGMSD